MIRKVTCLAGGVGAARFLQGLVEIVPQKNLTIVVNTGDDMELYGLHISPDPDIIVYTLAGIVDEQKGWGIRGDTFSCLNFLKRYDVETWFNVGDKDLATHIYRTMLLKNGTTLDKVTQKIAKAFGLEAKILPMTNGKVVSKIITKTGESHFEEYLVKSQAIDPVLNVLFEGRELADPAPGVLESLEETDGIIVCPSNPIVSIGPILALKEVRKALRETKSKIVAISPIVGGATIKGPADKLMRGLGHEVSSYGVALLYRDFLDAFIMDETDAAYKSQVEKLGIRAVTTNTIMRTPQDKVKLAQLTLETLEEMKG
ncbi:MAG: 2-phospho-L-lactate transferase [Candidatus Bathyarchaeota archaeon]|nr:2-phospho-L-lactate transferase [Candidatus Bathyarchaeota archaeon]